MLFVEIAEPLLGRRRSALFMMGLQNGVWQRSWASVGRSWCPMLAVRRYFLQDALTIQCRFNPDVALHDAIRRSRSNEPEADYETRDGSDDTQ